jgi:hypothetical protein
VGLDVFFHESNGTLTSGSEVLKPKFREACDPARCHPDPPTDGEGT